MRSVSELCRTELFPRIEEAGRGTLLTQGQGLMWGGLFSHPDPRERLRARKIFEEECGTTKVVPYFVPAGGFMVTPPLDVPAEAMADAADRLATAAERTATRLGWAADVTAAGVSMPRPNRDTDTDTVTDTDIDTDTDGVTDTDGIASNEDSRSPIMHDSPMHDSPMHAFVPKPYLRQRYLGPDPAAMTESQHAIHDDIVKTRPTTGISGPFGPWLANPALAWPSQTLGRVCR